MVMKLIGMISTADADSSAKGNIRDEAMQLIEMFNVSIKTMSDGSLHLVESLNAMNTNTLRLAEMKHVLIVKGIAIKKAVKCLTAQEAEAHKTLTNLRKEEAIQTTV